MWPTCSACHTHAGEHAHTWEKTLDMLLPLFHTRSRACLWARLQAANPRQSAGLKLPQCIPNQTHHESFTCGKKNMNQIQKKMLINVTRLNPVEVSKHTLHILCLHIFKTTHSCAFFFLPKHTRNTNLKTQRPWICIHTCIRGHWSVCPEGLKPQTEHTPLTEGCRGCFPEDESN